jgi:hypothetical protein
MCRKTNAVTTTKARRLEWAGHLLRTCHDKTVKKVFLRKPDERRNAGRPKIRWLDCIGNDLKSMGVKMKEAEDRSVWLSFCRRYWLNYKDRKPKKKKRSSKTFLEDEQFKNCRPFLTQPPRMLAASGLQSLLDC